MTKSVRFIYEHALKTRSFIYRQILILPPYCPELNPIERLWQYIKNHTIRNRIFQTIEELEIAVCDFVKKLSWFVVRSVCKD